MDIIGIVSPIMIHIPFLPSIINKYSNNSYVVNLWIDLLVNYIFTCIIKPKIKLAEYEYLITVRRISSW